MKLCHSESAPIRVLQVVTYMGRGGIETMIMNYYRHIDRSKVQFDFLVHRDFRADYDNEIEELGGKIYRLPRLIPWSRSYHKSLNDFLTTHSEYKIIHSHLNCMSSVILKAAKKRGTPVRIAHSHCSSADNILKLYFRRQLPKYATQLFACGNKAGDWMFNGESYRVINNAIHTEQYAYNSVRRQKIREELKISDNVFVVGHVGRFELEKNHTFLLDVFAEVKKQRQEAVLLLVGDGKLRLEIEGKAKRLDICDSVIFTGVRCDVSELMQAMDCFVFPSIFEGLPLVLVEAQASGLPCVISEGVPPEAVMTKITSRISLSTGEKAWAQCILNEYGRDRLDTREDIVNTGYDIKANVQYLQDYYLEQWKRVK